MQITGSAITKNETKRSIYIIMKESVTVLHQEIKKVANMQSLIQTRIFTLLSTLLIMFYYIAYHYGLYCLYIFFFSLFAPSVLEHTFSEKELSNRTQILPVLKQTFHYDARRYYCLYITFWLSNILLAAWQFNAFTHLTPHRLANIFPSIVFFGNIFFYLFFSYYYRLKIHYQLLNNRW